MMNEDRRPRKTCWFFKNEVCRNGKNCRYEHPEICNEWYELGRCKGVNGDCELSHPKICSKYAKRESCPDRYCLYMHPRGMKKTDHGVG